MSKLNDMLKNHTKAMDEITATRIKKQEEFKRRQAAAWEEIKQNNLERDLALSQFRLEVGRLSRGTQEVDVFEQLVMATEVIKNPRRQVTVLGVGNTTCIKGLKRTELVCEDGVVRVITYRGNLKEAVPTGKITLIDINEDIN